MSNGEVSTRNHYAEEHEKLLQMYRHPAAQHIPKEHLRSVTTSGFPWVVSGWRIILHMMKNEESVSEGGIVLPDVQQGSSMNKELTRGIVVAHGRGQLAYGHWVSPEWDYDIRVTDVVFIEPNVGIPIRLEDKVFRVVAPHDIVMRLARDAGVNTRKKLADDARSAIEFLASRKDDAGLKAGFLSPGKVSQPGYIQEQEDVVEKIRSTRGKRTKVMVSVPKKET